MTITRKPSSSAVLSASDIEALINRGGSIAHATEDKVHSEVRVAPVIVRIPSSLLYRIDALVSGRELKTPRHTWLLEALLEKVNREELGG